VGWLVTLIVTYSNSLFQAACAIGLQSGRNSCGNPQNVVSGDGKEVLNETATFKWCVCFQSGRTSTGNYEKSG
jgi:hypothetical protein